MAAHGGKGSGLEWFVRRGTAVRGPFTSTKVRHYVLEGKLSLSDEVSADRETWSPIGRMAEVVPPQMRPDEAGVPDPCAGLRRRERRRALRTILVSATLLALLFGGIRLVETRAVAPERDCGVSPAPEVFLEGCDLSHAELEGADLSDARLANTDLRSASLSGARFDGADMRYTDLTRADLSYGQLGAAVLLGATLRLADLTNADLRGTNLRFADLTGAQVGGVRFDGADLNGAIWIDGTGCGQADCPR